MPRSRRGPVRTAGERPVSACEPAPPPQRRTRARRSGPGYRGSRSPAHPGIGVVPAHPGRVRQRRRDGHVGQFFHQPGEYLRVARGNVRRVAVPHLAAGPELLGVHSQRTDTDHRRERPRARKPAPGQPGLRRDTRHGPAVIDARLHHDVRTPSQPETEHHRDLLQLEEHVGGFATQMVQTPSRQPVRQIAQRHSQDCATGTERTEAGFVCWTITGIFAWAVGARPLPLLSHAPYGPSHQSIVPGQRWWSGAGSNRRPSAFKGRPYPFWVAIERGTDMPAVFAATGNLCATGRADQCSGRAEDGMPLTRR